MKPTRQRRRRKPGATGNQPVATGVSRRVIARELASDFMINLAATAFAAGTTAVFQACSSGELAPLYWAAIHTIAACVMLILAFRLKRV